MNEMPVYNLKTLTKKLDIKPRTLREYIKEGKLKAKKIGRTFIVTERSLQDFLRPES